MMSPIVKQSDSNTTGKINNDTIEELNHVVNSCAEDDKFYSSATHYSGLESKSIKSDHKNNGNY